MLGGFSSGFAAIGLTLQSVSSGFAATLSGLCSHSQDCSCNFAAICSIAPALQQTYMYLSDW